MFEVTDGENRYEKGRAIEEMALFIGMYLAKYTVKPSTGRIIPRSRSAVFRTVLLVCQGASDSISSIELAWSTPSVAACPPPASASSASFRRQTKCCTIMPAARAGSRARNTSDLVSAATPPAVPVMKSQRPQFRPFRYLLKAQMAQTDRMMPWGTSGVYGHTQFQLAISPAYCEKANIVIKAAVDAVAEKMSAVLRKNR